MALKSSKTIKALSKWSNFNAKNETAMARNLEEEISSIQLKEADRSLSQEELESLRSLVAGYNEIQTKLDSWWWQRSKCSWLANGGRNSNFFQAAATQHKQNNRIYNLERNGIIIQEQADLEKELRSYFSLRWCMSDETIDSAFPLPRRVLSAEES